MEEKDILELIKKDVWMMDVLETARGFDLPHWMIGAGFVRNKIWDYLHGFDNDKVPTADIDLIYFDKRGNNEHEDIEFSKKVSKSTGINWEIINQAYAHVWHNRGEYKSAEEALSEWVETPTCIAVRLNKDNTLSLFAPHGIDDLVNLIVRPSPNNFDKKAYLERQTKKRWKEKWPKLNILYCL